VASGGELDAFRSLNEYSLFAHQFDRAFVVWTRKIIVGHKNGVKKREQRYRACVKRWSCSSVLLDRRVGTKYRNGGTASVGRIKMFGWIGWRCGLGIEIPFCTTHRIF